MPAPLRAILLADAGERAAQAEQFFRSPPFLRAEGASHTLLVEDGASAQALPLQVRQIPGTERLDAISPYGYPGASDPLPSPPDPAAADFSATELVSIFVRDRIGPKSCFAGGTVRSQVQIADPTRPSGVRKRLSEQIRSNLRGGWSVATIPGPEADEGQRQAFARAYAETMARAGAAERYLFEPDYFEGVLAFERSWLLLAAREGSDPAAGALAAVSDDHLHYYLGGTANDALAESPMKNLFWAMIELSGELGLPLSLGGGVEPGDSLERFKRGFANDTAEFRTHEIVCDPAAYEELSAGAREPGGFFPAYRAP
jgi:hypothetical protein